MARTFRKTAFLEGGTSASLEEIGLLPDAEGSPGDIFVPTEAEPWLLR